MRYPTRESKSIADMRVHRIQNPLHGIPRDQLMHQVDTFTQEHGLQDFNESFRKGALVAQNPSSYEQLEELNEDDRDVLRREVTRESQGLIVLRTTKFLTCACPVENLLQTVGINVRHHDYAIALHN